MIKTFEEFNWNPFKKKMNIPVNDISVPTQKVSHSDIDPLGEEIWEDEKLVPRKYFYKTNFGDIFIDYVKIDKNKYMLLGIYKRNDPESYIVAVPKDDRELEEKLDIPPMTEREYRDFEHVLRRNYGNETINSYLKKRIKNYNEDI